MFVDYVSLDSLYYYSVHFVKIDLTPSMERLDTTPLIE